MKTKVLTTILTGLLLMALAPATPAQGTDSLKAQEGDTAFAVERLDPAFLDSNGLLIEPYIDPAREYAASHTAVDALTDAFTAYPGTMGTLVFLALFGLVSALVFMICGICRRERKRHGRPWSLKSMERFGAEGEGYDLSAAGIEACFPMTSHVYSNETDSRRGIYLNSTGGRFYLESPSSMDVRLALLVEDALCTDGSSVRVPDGAGGLQFFAFGNNVGCLAVGKPDTRRVLEVYDLPGRGDSKAARRLAVAAAARLNAALGGK